MWPADGTIGEILNEEGATILGEQVIAKRKGGAAAPAEAKTESKAKDDSKSDAAPAASGKTSDVKVPVLPESVADATIATWHVAVGEAVSRDQNLVDIETDKVVLEVVAPADGSLAEIIAEEGATVTAEDDCECRRCKRRLLQQRQAKAMTVTSRMRLVLLFVVYLQKKVLTQLK